MSAPKAVDGAATSFWVPPVLDLRTPDEQTASFQLMAQLRLAQTMRYEHTEPVLGPNALHGIAGDIVRALEPLTEATAPAMLATVLTTFGTMVGRRAHVMVGEQPHYPNLYTLVVGSTGKGRKGTSMSAVRPLLRAADDSDTPFLTTRVQKGLQSGEALIQALATIDQVRPPVTDAFDDPAALEPDQRLLVIEEEFARILEVAGRKNSTLSHVLRPGWDGEEMTNKTKAEELRATQPHLGVLGHVTSAELRATLAGVDVSNGFANRFLPIWSDRTRIMPTPGRLDDETRQALGARLRAALVTSRMTGEVRCTHAYEAAWNRLYYLIEMTPTGGHLYDALTARASAHIKRLSLVYALLDGSSTLEPEHLSAALALWEYCEATIVHVWGATLGSPDLDRLWHELAGAGTNGLNRTAARNVFSRNKTSAELNELVQQLVDRGLARVEVRRPTTGRPSEVLVPVEQ